MKIGKVSYNGVSSDSLGIFVTGAGTFAPAELDTVSYQIAGRSGDLIVSNNRYKNVSVVYPAFVPNDFENRVQSIRNWLRSATAYKRIEDNYDSDHFRMGLGRGVEFTPSQQNVGSNIQFEFDCKPQRFLKTGETALTPANNSTITNPTQYDAKPLIQFSNPTSSAVITIAHTGATFTFTATTSYTGSVTIDCETQNIYSGSNNLNSKFTVTGGFPVLAAGSNTITYSGVTGLTLTPRWWEL